MNSSIVYRDMTDSSIGVFPNLRESQSLMLCAQSELRTTKITNKEGRERQIGEAANNDMIAIRVSG